MPQFLINARDKAGALELCMANRPQHLKWAKSRAGRILMARPVFADDDESFAGSTFGAEFDMLEDAKAWTADDPYAKARLFDAVEIRPFKWLLGDGK
ncbi:MULTISPECIES: YciI family protein [Henriciella]|jgi:uncharacterized protein YciI|uniref:YCII-related domain-containing protein n=1 Tax=Henriciella pelagia TaxID=1977912 RepID=A0ABQ1JNA4_9PROT|nr:YciI family protein [Henriciella pelagia]GGB73361.1 hypothetical protein GCM10011503_22550 [Henriciella pelagia]